MIGRTSQRFNDLKNNPSMTPREFAIDMVSHFVPHDYTQRSNENNDGSDQSELPAKSWDI